MTDQDEYFMKQALQMAEDAYRANEVPVGAVIVLDGEIIGKGRNSVITDSDPTAHAEIVALRQAGKAVGNYRLPGADIYVTLEPCLMCYTALIHARIRKLVYAAPDAKTGFFTTGALEQIKNISDRNIFNHTITLKSGIIGSQSTKMLQSFFKERRGAGAVERGGLENR